ncbi:hypothetical protein MKX01_033077 [Papaver californicum]|nr:hypothetical protein MKX01_033077 [Papaver californicum]
METPSSVRRMTRSQAKAVFNSIPMSRKNEETEKYVTRKKKPERSALTDISNDSPIVGLAMGSIETPSSFIKKLDQPKKTPGSGEALLRFQVKSLLQKVEEEAELSKLTFENRPFIQGIANSPSALLAPANTPQVLNLPCNDMNVDAIISETLAQAQEESKNHQMVIDEQTGNTLESQKSLITRLLFDFPEKLESSDSSSSPGSSVLTYDESSAEKEKSTDEDDASIWSIQVNASTKDEDEEGEIEEVEQEEEEYYDEEEEYEDVENGGFLGDLCEGLSKITLQEKKLPGFEGKHTRFIYNSDGEIEGEEDISVSPSKLRLKDLPVPEGKHLRFPDEE